LHFIVDDHSKGEGLSVLSNSDILHIIVHFAELAQTLVNNDFKEFEKVFSSRNIRRIVFSLMSNTSDSADTTMRIMSTDREKGYKRDTFHLDPQYFHIDGDEIKLLPNMHEAFKIAVTKLSKQKEMRYCPASYAPDAVKVAIEFLRKEILDQYKKFLKTIKD